MKLKLPLLYKFFCIICLFFYGLIIAGIVFPVLHFICSANKAKSKRDRLKIHWLKVFSSIMKLSVIREGELPKDGALLISNHISWLDIIVIGQYLPVYFVAKSDISSWPIIGYLSRQGGTIFIRRGNKKSIKATTEKMIWVLKQNSNIVAFPEGTTTLGNEVLSFHASLFQPALLTKSVIQPVVIQYEGAAKHQAPFIGEDDFVRHLIKMLCLDKVEVRLSFLPVIKSLGKDRHTVCAEAREKIYEKISESSPVNKIESNYLTY
jgi:1-acyl-sn-glycerol-3-phosphate acyltransferase